MMMVVHPNPQELVERNSAGLATGIAQSTGNIIAHAIHGHSALETAIMEFEYFVLGNLKDFGANLLSSMMGLLPGNFFSSVCIQAAAPICKRIFSYVFKYMTNKDDFISLIRPQHVPKVEYLIGQSKKKSPEAVLKILDEYGHSHAIFSFYSRFPKSVAQELLVIAAKDEDISEKAIHQLLKVRGVDLGSNNNDILLTAANARNWMVVDRLIKEKFISVSLNANLVLRFVEDQRKEIINNILLHPSFDAMADGLSIINWAAEQKKIQLLCELLNDHFSKSSFNSYLVFKTLTHAYLHSKDSIKQSYLNEAIQNLFQHPKFEPVDLLPMTIRFGLTQFLPDLLAHRNSGISYEDPFIQLYRQINTKNHHIDLALSLWAIRHLDTTLLENVLSKQDKDLKSFCDELFIKAITFGIDNIFSIPSKCKSYQNNSNDLIFHFKAGNLDNILAILNKDIVSISQNQNQLLKLIFLDYLDTELLNKWKLSKLIDRIIKHDSFTLVEDTRSILIFVRHFFLCVDTTTRTVIGRWISELLQHKSFQPSSFVVGEMVIRGAFSHPFDALEWENIETWFNFILDDDKLRLANDKTEFALELFEGFLSAESNRKVIIIKWIDKLMNSASFYPSENDNILALKLVNNLVFATENAKQITFQLLNNMFNHILFDPSIGDNALLLDLIEYLNLFTGNEKSQIIQWINAIIDHKMFRPSIGDNKVIHRLLLMFKMENSIRFIKTQSWINQILSHPDFIPENAIDEFKSACLNASILKKAIICEWVRKLDDLYAPKDDWNMVGPILNPNQDTSKFKSE